MRSLLLLFAAVSLIPTATVSAQCPVARAARSAVATAALSPTRHSGDGTGRDAVAVRHGLGRAVRRDVDGVPDRA